MKKLTFSILLLLFSASFAVAQKYAYVDTDYILSQIPDYKQAQSQLDNMSSQWQGEIESLFSEAASLESALNAEKILLTDEMVAEREQMIKDKNKEARDLQIKYFGAEGELFVKRQELIKPIQDQVFNAVQTIAKKKKIDIVFDKSSGLIMLYANSKSDISEDVLESLGY